MGQAELQDPEVLRQFIGTLQSFNRELEQRCQNLTGQWTALQSVWRDPICERFASEWETALRAIQSYLNGSDEYVTHLQTKLRQVEDYS